MIQAPQLQYIPAQQVMPMNYQLPGANQAVQYQQTPGYYYNYPTSSCYAQPQAKSQFNGVNIEIINPQGQGYIPQIPAIFFILSLKMLISFVFLQSLL